MLIKELEIKGAYLIEMEEFADNRGTFSRQFCQNELAKININFEIKQCNFSKNTSKGVLRGLHYQKEPYSEIKMVSCFRGEIYDVLVDVRPESPTYLKWISQELSEENRKIIYIPKGVAHGFQTLVDNSYVYYQLSEYFRPELYSGIRWDDPALNIEWPDCDCRILSERDSSYEFIK